MVKQYLNGCTKLIAKGEYLEAIVGYEFILKLDPLSIQAFKGIAICYANLKKWQKALEFILSALVHGGNRREEMLVFIDILELSELNSYVDIIERTLLISMKDPTIEHRAIPLLSQQVAAKHPQSFSCQAIEFNEGTNNLIQDKSFCILLERNLVNNYLIEDLLKLSRKEILQRASHGKDICAYLPFLSSLACQLLLNDGLYSVSEDESILLNQLTKKNRLTTGEMLVQICYLNFADMLLFWKENKKTLSMNKLTNIVNDLQFYTEVVSAENVNILENGTSKKVQSFYINNPYPKWKAAKIKMDVTGLSPIFEQCGKIIPSTLNVLFAGCGTGKQLVNLALIYPKANITAIDISPTSLAYAKLMIEKYNIKNINFQLLDILKISQLKLSFDYIVCTGVLHHMASPQNGLNSLADVLNPDGIMLLAFYSKRARENFANIKNNAMSFLETTGTTISREGVKKWRGQISSEQKLNDWYCVRDFFNLNGLYDLLFHPQQTEYLPKELKSLVQKAKLSFEWMSNVSNAEGIASKYPIPTKKETWEYWDMVERDNPDTFTNMFNFYVTKSISSLEQ